MTDTDHICEVPKPERLGQKYQCTVCFAEWLAAMDDEGCLGWYQDVTPEQAAKQVEDLMHELAHEDIDPAVIRAHVQHASFAVQQIVSIVGPSHGDAAATAIREGWNRFVRTVQPYFLDRPCDHHSFMEGRPNASGT